MRSSDLGVDALPSGGSRRSLIRRAVSLPVVAIRVAWRRSGQAIARAAQISGVVLRRLILPPDHKWWSSLQFHEDWWDLRAAKVARLVPPTARVIDFGAGRSQLESLLDSSCSYLASDIVDRGPGTLICDLNASPLPNLDGVAADTAVFCGVLEYVRDLESLVAWLSGHVSFCVASYDCAPMGRYSIGYRWRRFYYRYASSYTEAALVVVFDNKGFSCITRDRWRSQRVFVFVNRQSTQQGSE